MVYNIGIRIPLGESELIKLVVTQSFTSLVTTRLSARSIEHIQAMRTYGCSG